MPADSPIRTVADLRGKTVGVSRGSGSHYVLAAALKRAGLTLSDIKPAYLQAPEGAVAFDQGALDAWSIWDPFLAFAEAKRPVRVIADGTGLTSYHRYYLVNDSFVAAQPEVVATVYRSLVEAGIWMKANPEEAVALLAPIWGDLPPAVVAAANSRRTYAVEPVERAQLGEQQAIADVFYEAKLIPRRIDATDVPIFAIPPAGAEAMASVPRFGIWAAVHGSRASTTIPTSRTTPRGSATAPSCWRPRRSASTRCWSPSTR